MRIRNLGRVPIEFSMVDSNALKSDRSQRNVAAAAAATFTARAANDANGGIEADKPMIKPMRGFVKAEDTETVIVRYLPGAPKKFTKQLQIQVSHFAPESITICGEAGFAQIMLDLPRHENETYKMLKNVRK